MNFRFFRVIRSQHRFLLLGGKRLSALVAGWRACPSRSAVRARPSSVIPVPASETSGEDPGTGNHLQGAWAEINDRHFSGELEPLAAVDWGEISGNQGIGAHGVFFPQSRCIVIDEKFRFVDKLVRAGNEAETCKVEWAYRLLMHEMVHQALFQRNAPKPGKHAEAFLAEAIRISKQLGEEPPIAANVHRWPLHLILSA
jgi:hypothetical protein